MLYILLIFAISVTSTVTIAFFKLKNKLEIIISFIILSVLQVFLSVLITGVLGILDRGIVVLFHFLTSSVTLILLYNKKLKNLINKKKTLINFFSKAKTEIKSIRKNFKKDFVKIAVILAIIALSYVSFLNIVLPVHDWDGFMYHLFLPANWIQNSSLSTFNASPELRLDKWVYFTANMELFSTWHLLNAGNDDYVEFFQFPVIIAGILALIGICRIFGVKNKYAVWMFPCFLSIPIVLSQMNSTYIDVSVVSLFFTAIYLLMRGFITFNKLILFCGFVSGGILLGSKSTGPLFFVLAFTAAALGYLIFEFKFDKVKSFLIKIFSVGFLYVLIGVLLGGYFFIRNYSEKKNPFYPYGLNVLGVKIFKGIDPIKQTTFGKKQNKAKFLKSSYKDNYRQFVYNYYGHNYAGHGPFPYVLGLPSLIFAIYFFIKNRKWRRLLFFIILGSICFFCAIVMPSVFTRFTLVIDLFSIIAVIIAVSGLSFGRNILQLFFVFLIIYNFIITAPMNFHMKWHIKKSIKTKKQLSAADSPYSGRSFKAIDNLLSDSNTVVAYAGLLMPYPLFGRTLSRKVIYISGKNPKNWQKRLNDNNVNYIVLGNTGFAYKERSWVESFQAKFKPIIVNKELTVYLFINKKNLKLHNRLLKNG